MVSFTFLAGGYDAFVATYLFSSRDASLTLIARSPTGANCTWLSIPDAHRNVLYANNAVPQGVVQAFTITPGGVLSPVVSTISSGGQSPTFATALSTGELAVVNYVGGNGRVIPAINNSPIEFDDSAGTITFPASEGRVSHPHHVVEYRNELFIPDLGVDTVWRLRKRDNVWSIAGSITQPANSGPRHIAIRDERLFTLHELSSTLTVQRIPSISTTEAPLIANVSILPTFQPEGARYAAAEILFPAPTRRFPTSYIYVSNRNVGSTDTVRGDSIAIFQHVNAGKDNEGLKLIKQVFTGINQVRGIQIGRVEDGGEEYLVAGGVVGTAGVKVFKRVEGGRDLVEVAVNQEVPTRTSFVWL